MKATARLGFVLLTTLIVALALSGCGTIIGRGKQNWAGIEMGVYPATRTDAFLFWTCLTGNSVFQTHSSGLAAPIAGYTVIPLCSLVDLPISLVTDTAMLPFDVHRMQVESATGRYATSVTIPTNVTSIGDCEFQYHYRLTNITIGASVTSIGEGAFMACTNLAGVTLPPGVTNIGKRAFTLCDRLTKVTIPASVTGIGAGAFSQCANLVAITVDEDNPMYSSAEGVLFDKRKETILLCPSRKAGSYSMPSSVTRIGNEAFAYCTNLTTVMMSPGVGTIGDYAFNYCTSLTSVTIPTSVTNIGSGAFAFCFGLTNMLVGSGVTSIGASAFTGCNSLLGIYFKGNAPSLGSAVYPSTTVYYLPGTTGWGREFGGRPTAAWKPQAKGFATPRAEGAR